MLDDLLLDERGADTSSMSQDQETTKDRQLMLLPLSQGVDEQRLYNTIQRTVKLQCTYIDDKIFIKNLQKLMLHALVTSYAEATHLSWEALKKLLRFLSSR